jgi:segregation and condensation protein B
MKNLKQTIEAIVFAAGESVSYEEIAEYLPEVSLSDIKNAVSELKSEYSGEKGIHMLTFNNKVQFSSNPAYGEIIADILTPIKERMLSKSLMEVLSIIAYRGPVTRSDMESIRGVNSDYALTVLLKMNLVANIGKKDAPGKPSLFATTDEFLKKFSLQTLDDLPDYDEVMQRIKLMGEVEYNERTESLYREVDVDVENGIQSDFDTFEDNEEDEDEGDKDDEIEDFLEAEKEDDEELGDYPDTL